MKTIAKLFFLFTLVSAIEVFLLLELTRATSWWVTLITIFVPGVLGAWLAKREGGRAFRQVIAAISLQTEPTGAIVDGAIVLCASVLLIAPGVLTDVTGLLLLVPPVRRVAREYAKRRLRRAIDRKLSSGAFRVVDMGGFGAAGGGGGEIIDAEDIPKSR